MPLRYRIASQPWEFEQIHRLNYRTFVEEIPQHPANPERRLVDPFHEENTYVVCVAGGRVVGMLALRGRRPFSLDRKLKDLDSYLPPSKRICELRLLAVEREHRRGRVFVGLLGLAAAQGLREGYDLAVISGTTRQFKLYRHLGFVPFGPLVGSHGAQFQPMYLTLAAYRESTEPVLTRARSASERPRNFLPGPVEVSAAVRRAFARPPDSHRSAAFLEAFTRLRRRLCALAAAEHVQVLLGSGTLANDAVAAQLALAPGTGLVLVNGEFGERLADHARRWGLDHRTHGREWGAAFSREEILETADAGPELRWLWAAHCETSTGALNDLDLLRGVCRERGLLLCLDCVSSIGTVPLDLREVHLASASSGKGLASYPGLSMVFSRTEPRPAPQRLPRYLDLGAYAAAGGVPYTTSSNLVAALQAALHRFDGEDPYRRVRELGALLRRRLRGAGFAPVAPEEHAAPAVVTLALPSGTSAEALGDLLAQEGFLLSYRSAYLLRRNWVQIALMGEVDAGDVEAAVRALADLRHLASPAAG